MKCPYCGEEMHPGRISSPHVLAWTPDEDTFWDLTPWSRSKNSVLLRKADFLGNASVPAFYCPPCKKVVIKAAGE